VPLFEYRCRDCSKQFTFLAGVVSSNSDALCPRCGSNQLQKLISRVARGRSDDDRMEAMADRMESRDMDDPAELRRFAREMGRDMAGDTGEDMTPEIEEMIESECRGQGDAGGCGACGGDDGTIY
jgi:putative FmdB family regulatory protein